jgi:hypothetical protein
MQPNNRSSTLPLLVCWIESVAISCFHSGVDLLSKIVPYWLGSAQNGNIYAYFYFHATYAIEE